MYKNKAKQQEANREASRKYRQKGMTEQGMTEEGMTQYPKVLQDIVDPVKREKLIRICNSLGERKLLDRVWYGLNSGLTMKEVDLYIKATR